MVDDTRVASQHALVSQGKMGETTNWPFWTLSWLKNNINRTSSYRNPKIHTSATFSPAPSAGTNTESNLVLTSLGGQHVYKKAPTLRNTSKSSRHWNPAVTLSGLLSKQQQQPKWTADQQGKWITTWDSVYLFILYSREDTLCCCCQWCLTVLDTEAMLFTAGLLYKGLSWKKHYASAELTRTTFYFCNGILDFMSAKH